MEFQKLSQMSEEEREKAFQEDAEETVSSMKKPIPAGTVGGQMVRMMILAAQAAQKRD